MKPITLEIQQGEVSRVQLETLAERARCLAALLKTGNAETRLPVAFEFAGSPKSGKSSIIGLVSLFLRRMNFRVSTPPEGASLETPPDLKDDLLAFNAWCGCYTVQNLLIRSHEGDPSDILLLDRGMFDWIVWMEFLKSKEETLRPEIQRTITEFAMIPEWMRRARSIFLFTSDAQTALERERASQLTTRPGRAMNERFLRDLADCYWSVISERAYGLPQVYLLDTSRQGSEMPSFQQIAFTVASTMLAEVTSATEQVLLAIDPVREGGFIDDSQRIDTILRQVLHAPKFVPRAEAENTLRVQQVVPYGILRNSENRYLCARRRSDEPRPTLAGRRTMLFGGHAEKRDWDSGDADGVLRRCLERELHEELIGLAAREFRLIGIVNDLRNEIGSKHLAFLHEVVVNGRIAVRRQTTDKEFGREPVEWRTADEIVGEIDRFDPWSQLVAAKLFGAKPGGDAQQLLFHPS